MTLHAGCAVSSCVVWAATYHLPLPGIALNIGNQLLLLRLELGPLAVELAPRTLQSTQVLAQALLGGHGPPKEQVPNRHRRVGQGGVWLAETKVEVGRRVGARQIRAAQPSDF